MPKYEDVGNELPLLTVVYNAPAAAPVVLNLYPNWEQTGECHIAYTEIEELTQAAQLLAFVVDAAADELFAARRREQKGNSADNADIPF